jgi:hypothetical protein
MLLQIDASSHAWLEGRGPWLTLVAVVDDATEYAWARFTEAETTWAYFQLTREIICAQGLPLGLYSDRPRYVSSFAEANTGGATYQ